MNLKNPKTKTVTPNHFVTLCPQNYALSDLPAARLQSAWGNWVQMHLHPMQQICGQFHEKGKESAAVV